MTKITMAIWCLCYLLISGCGQASESGINDPVAQIADAGATTPTDDATEPDNKPDATIELANQFRARRYCALDGDCAEPKRCIHEECQYILPPFPDGGWFY